MKFGIRAALQALLEADDQIGGKTLGESALTLVRRYRSQQESACTMRNGIEILKRELNEAQKSETAALAKFDGARDAADNLRAQIVGLGFEHDDLVRERDALREQSKTFEAQRDAAQLSECKFAARLDDAHAQITTLTDELANLHAEKSPQDRVTERAENEVTIRHSYGVGDTVPWDLVTAAKEDGCLWAKTFGGLPFVMVWGGRISVMATPTDPDIEEFLAGGAPAPTRRGRGKATLIARNLGSNPEQWRDAMQQHLMQKGTK